MTSAHKEKSSQKDLINKGRQDRQKTLDKLSIRSSQAQTYDKDSDDESRKCS